MESLDIMEEVITFDGTTAPRKDCKYIKGKYYIKNKQCFLFNGLWYRINSNKVTFDHEYECWVLLDSSSINLLYGIISIENRIPKFGHFTINKIKNSYLYFEDSIYPVFDESILKECNDVEEGVTGIYYFKNDSTVPSLLVTKLVPNKNNYYSFPFNYGSEELIPVFSESFNQFFKGDLLLSNNYKALGNYTFGIEFETYSGSIPEKHLFSNGLIACRDGSISGFEYVTIPLSGEKGIQCIKKVCDLLKKYCECSENESLHIHVGGYPKTMKSIAALFRLSRLIEKEIYSLFPYFYVNTGNFKRKSYCNPMYNVGVNDTTPREIFNSIFRYLSGGLTRFSKFPVGTHPMDRSGQHKWEISPRYHWMNLIPLIWGSRGTVEFRCHTPTVESQKVINWLYIIVAILKYARKHANELTSDTEANLSKVTLSVILKEAYRSKIVYILEKYINSRKNYYSKKNDLTGKYEILSESKDNDLISAIPFV